MANLGCGSKPQAPVLRSAPFYQNDSEGFRFLVPEGWQQTASALLPPGDFEDEVYLVRYSMKTPERGAMMVVLVMQEKSPINMTEHLSGPSFRVMNWKPEADPESLNINGFEIEHHVLLGKIGERTLTKDVYVFRNAGRIYSFIGLYWNQDSYGRQQILRAINSLQKS